MSRTVLKDRVKKYNTPQYEADWSASRMEVFSGIARSPIFNGEFLKRLFENKAMGLRELTKMQILQRFNDFYVDGKNTFIPSMYFREKGSAIQYRPALGVRKGHYRASPVQIKPKG
jgi:hypothetical protein